MGTYKWDGLDKNGKRGHGHVVARNEKEARKILRSQGVRPKKLTPPSFLEFDISEWMIENGYAKGFGVKELNQFTKQLAIMINAGVPIIQSLEILNKAEKHPVLKRTVSEIGREVSEGATIADAMRKQKGFSPLYCNLVKAGESAGILDTILTKLAEHMEKQEKTKAQIKSAMTYPAIVVLVGIGVIWGLMVFVVPQFMGMLESNGQEVPAITQFVVDCSNFFQEYTSVLLPSFGVFIWAMLNFIKSKFGKPIFDNFMMQVPVFGGIVIKGNLSSFSRTIATMLSSGIALIDALAICIDTLDNVVIANDIKEVKRQVTQGKTLFEPLSRINYFPDMVASMIRIGEQTGSLDAMFMKVSSVFEEEVNQLVTDMTKLIEPIIIVVLGGIVAVILVAMYLPIFMSAG
ncbi:MAG: type II secretion system F family protein [Bacteriovoracaceae bacterium]|nr:type II secretion system F family protein [Bacteriovoracaceae bacterium]